ncbi:hypothetical protein A3B05_00030 [Candidatus Giovannonibacteria bacterium RIFCSPLOWO2_01_FULL_43_160]|uniref:Restriction endonuclease type IV Mrr domain-containing protein n=2 Tax=Candidatus Giovannoniibacteriota TaxID=1752738 RepID=A0A0G1LVR4_9BACT|nr:MAG: hypothetical protein UV72_C0001G0063 [Candidatus Giovannonibacteria bacterium GW2011_GWB1_43_13]KKS99734.1 MAG: hypothetical protein UV75_C0002G0115 [Candidatus Giovannonibacteria bacterium GW2011_GWA1_43_15]KKT21856.1 MAG: hypothetical protein UW05_C0001G0003 [Candidatus Giovannonibacteria bacterium GW2011_GWC2_43_8]KKT63819.1 MAG: hypothetical protein UW55_C0001G0112 [Candidatus Giovannonibacteria bacterium GW2011_GWA2_44_26]OGF58880.1 MAG: hypothetical protein A2652_03430 [Candidatus
MTKLLKEQFVQDCISNYLSKLGYHKQEPKGLREHGVDIKVKHKNFGRYYLVEVKGDPGKDVKSPGGSRNSCMNSAIGQIITRMHTNRKRGYKYGYKYGIGFPISFKERVINKIPYDVCDKLNLNLFFVHPSGVVEAYNDKKLKALQK